MKKLAIITTLVLGASLGSFAADAGSATPLRGNPESKVIHKSGCRYYTNTTCTATFSTREAATGAGYTPCKVCKP